MLRLFIAANLPQEHQHQLQPLLEQIRRSPMGGIRWSRPDQLHITLKFLGPTEEKLVEPISQALKKVGGAVSTFSAELGELGTFKNHRIPRVLWLGIGNGKQEFKKLAKKLDVALAPLQISKEAREFNPHITIVRFKRDASPREIAQYEKLISSVKAPVLPPFMVDQIHLMQSLGTPEGSSYKTLLTVPLG